MRREPADPNVIFVFWVLGFFTAFFAFTGEVVTLGLYQIIGLLSGIGVTYILSYFYYRSFEEDEEVG